MKKIKLVLFLLLLAVLLGGTLSAEVQNDNRWKINNDGSITWTINNQLPHYDHIEMSGLKVSTVVRYGVDQLGAFHLNRGMVWPQLRTIPNNTNASLMRHLAWNALDLITINGKNLANEKVKSITLNGLMTVNSCFAISKNDTLVLTRTLFPSVSNPAFCEKYTLYNASTKDMQVEIPQSESRIQTDPQNGVDGSYLLVSKISGATSTLLKPGGSLSFGAYHIGYKPSETPFEIDVNQEEVERGNLIHQFWSNLVLETPDTLINTMFAFAKIRAAESIYQTKCGLLHGPGGESYYAAIWANDQAEYVGPFFPYLGYDVGNKASLNAYLQFARFMNPQYHKLPSSIIAEGLDVWEGAGDRGDAAMIAYGASRYALARGNLEEAQQLWPLITWCLEYCKRKLNREGVVTSDADELEGRFPSGTANLCTSSLYYDALNSGQYLGKSMGKSNTQLAEYAHEAKELKKAIDHYFGGTVEGFNAYKYYEGNTVLRAWICIPLTVGIYDRKNATIQALFSPRLWTKDGLLTQAGSETFWDRSTLYALRGVFACGEREKAMNYLEYYSQHRLLGEHVPYAIEAWPEGGQRHLSAESGLYCRVITEGVFGMRPTGLKSFNLTPQLPQAWSFMKLKKINAFGTTFNIEAQREGAKIRIQVMQAGKMIVNQLIENGTTIPVKLSASTPTQSQEISITSSNAQLNEAFGWAKTKALSFVQTGKKGKINISERNDQSKTTSYIPSYWAGYPYRTAFYSRDFCHQLAGAHLLGLDAENFSMMKAFARSANATRKWYPLWAINFDGSTYTLDHHNDQDFVREVPAVFELVEKIHQLYLWTGDKRYYQDEAFWQYCSKAVTDFITLHDSVIPNGVAEGTTEGIFAGTATYNESPLHPLIEAEDGIACQYKAYQSYAALAALRGRDQVKKVFEQKADSLRNYFNKDWGIKNTDSYNLGYDKDLLPVSGWGKETSWFVLLKGLANNNARTDKYLDFIEEQLESKEGIPENIESITYLPELFFEYNRCDLGWKWMKYIIDKRNEMHCSKLTGVNGNYPEVSYLLMSQVVQGMAGVIPDAANNKICTYSHLPSNISYLNIENVKMGNSLMTIKHQAHTSSELYYQQGEKKLLWKAGFTGSYVYLYVNGVKKTCQQESLHGVSYSYYEVSLKKGERISVSTKSTN